MADGSRPGHGVRWSDDCQGKKDFDGDLVSVSTRYWPGYMTVHDGTRPEEGLHQIPTGGPTARSSIILGDINSISPVVLASAEFEGDTEAEVKAKVEEWVGFHFARVVGALLKEFGATPHRGT